ncbi:MAG: DNA internalization-related competence protein ComEC/Rec2 [Burkholderiaceae bacterium]|uniref:DNA internalization-related competence protein ComEC/Rec2 n=1 Tax=Herminiimonas contaminans TaxID=1111140 RepID=A0ABS0EQ48_9BURK|nr:DNA internalization-related competence protein ComEC/Rec2 [Herminiimonas contaminans]MBF8176979.1 DNA internalization-related competence protein ComEC/Rec2 [Herminiimonas contaminans]MBX9799792.1 DNA internalization-related competence protein ComEC/Rec2 [Burkholderiaceae bacterium]
MRSAILGFVLGAAWLQTCATLPQYFTILLLLIAACVLIALARYSILKKFKMPLFVLFGTALGFVWAALFAQFYLSHELPKELEGRDITVIGTVASLPNYFERGVRFNFAVEDVLPVDGVVPTIPGKLALSWYTSFNPADATPVSEIHAGERWQLTLRLKRPHGNANPYGFDYERWLLEQNIRATGYVRPDQKAELKNQRLSPFVFSFNNVVERGRGWLRSRIERTLEGKPYAGVIVALVVGDQRAISQSDWAVFNRTGVSHLISISGLHITMIAAMFAGLVFALWRRSFFTSARLPLFLPAQKAAALAGGLAALVYVLLAGAGVPAQRTLYMLTVVALALWHGRITNVSYVLCVALGVVVLLDPWAVLGPGFWLSFGAVAVILYVSVGRARPPSQSAGARWRVGLKNAGLTQYAVTLGLVPFTVLLFGQASLVSPIANAVAIPLVSFFVTPLALAGSVLPAPLSAWCLVSAHFLVEMLAQLLGWMSSWQLAVWTVPIPGWWMFGLALFGTLWMLAPRGWPVRYLGAFAWLPLLLNTATHPRAGEMWVTAFDVGQGMALLVETEKHRLLYDTGPVYSPESDGGNRVILPYLHARGINRLDAVMISHSDNDHSGGALSILKEIEVAQLSSSLPLDHPIVSAAPSHQRCTAGQAWEWDGARFEVLHPSPESYDSSKWKPNARSCTLKISVGEYAVLLPGDIEARQEAELVANQGDNLRAHILLAPHHGSGTSSTEPFLRAVDPQYAVFQVGYRNRYRHPKQEVYDRYGALGISRLRSDDTGAISLRFAQQMQVSDYRSEHARYWYGR